MSTAELRELPAHLARVRALTTLETLRGLTLKGWACVLSSPIGHLSGRVHSATDYLLHSCWVRQGNRRLSRVVCAGGLWK